MEHPFKEISLENRRILAKNIFNNLRTAKSSFWSEAGKKHSLALFREAVQRVPAYKNFITKKFKINPTKIISWTNFKKLPPVSKKNYLRKYKLGELVWDGTFDEQSVTFTTTSGSTGKPFYFPREGKTDGSEGFEKASSRRTPK